nr:MAG TPA: hypothetical protein [Caudoviricetes sp.]
MKMVLLKLYDRKTKELIATVTATRNMSIDDILNLMHYALDEEGRVVDANGELLNAWYDNLVIYGEV